MPSRGKCYSLKWEQSEVKILKWDAWWTSESTEWRTQWWLMREWCLQMRGASEKWIGLTSPRRVGMHCVGSGAEEAAAAVGEASVRRRRSASHRLVALLLVALPVARQVARHQVRRLSARRRAPVRRLVPPVQPVHETDPLPQRLRLRARAAQAAPPPRRRRTVCCCCSEGPAHSGRFSSANWSTTYYVCTKGLVWNTFNCPSSNVSSNILHNINNSVWFLINFFANYFIKICRVYFMLIVLLNLPKFLKILFIIYYNCFVNFFK